MTGSYLISEIEFALTLDYEILDIFECHAYFQTEFIFKKFVQALNYFKQINSLDCNDVTPDLCFALNQNLEESDFKFHPSAFKRNESKRNFYKLAANSLFGKIAQRSDYKKLVYVSSQEELEQLFFSANEIQEISCLNDQVCQVLLKPLIKNCTPNRNTNCTIGSQITAFARQEIYEHILRLESIPSAVLYYVDCDCLIFSLPKDVPCPVPISPKCGDFKVEYDGISNFMSMGIKSYCMSYKNKDSLNKICKIKGLRLSFQGNPFNEELFDSYLKAFLKNERLTTQVRQRICKGDFKKFKTKFEEKNISFSNTVTPNRILVNDDRITSVPYGFICNRPTNQ